MAIYLTLTRVVFECEPSSKSNVLCMHLTLTRVVFELSVLFLFSSSE